MAPDGGMDALTIADLIVSKEARVVILPAEEPSTVYRDHHIHNRTRLFR